MRYFLEQKDGALNDEEHALSTSRCNLIGLFVKDLSLMRNEKSSAALLIFSFVSCHKLILRITFLKNLVI